VEAVDWTQHVVVVLSQKENRDIIVEAYKDKTIFVTNGGKPEIINKGLGSKLYATENFVFGFHEDHLKYVNIN